MGEMGDGQWKEGRLGGVSLCYLEPDPATLSWIIEHHAAVGIRATCAVSAVEPIAQSLPILAERNWDLAVSSSTDPLATQTALQAIDHRDQRGLILPPDQSPDPDHDWTYQLTEGPGAISPATRLTPPILLSGTVAPGELDPVREAMEETLTTGLWRIWLIDATALHALGQTGHAALLRFLGDHHDRIWCAPVRDILLWHIQRHTA